MNFKITLVLILLASCFGYGQQSIKGTVVDENSIPLMGVSIVVANSANGTTTDFDGNYTISATIGEVLIFSSMGFKTEQVTVSDATIVRVTLVEDAAALEEVVITALGIKREKKH
ncbi:carboxypeptidase-like regulatory domain-containing protein [Cellulophaga baltica 4]|nr:carboxypeptidase-like regulatory domain-containing protein [Cellulophaga baltica 4]